MRLQIFVINVKPWAIRGTRPWLPMWPIKLKDPRGIGSRSRDMLPSFQILSNENSSREKRRLEPSESDFF